MPKNGHADQARNSTTRTRNTATILRMIGGNGSTMRRLCERHARKPPEVAGTIRENGAQALRGYLIQLLRVHRARAKTGAERRSVKPPPHARIRAHVRRNTGVVS